MERERVTEIVTVFHDKIGRAIKNKHYNSALELIFPCALLLYTTNVYYVDDALEESVREIANGLFSTEIKRVERDGLEQDTILFYDGVGLDVRGLARIYLEALVRDFKVCYVTCADREQEIPGILRTVRENGGTVSFIGRTRPVGMIKQLNTLLHKCRAGKFFFYAF